MADWVLAALLVASGLAPGLIALAWAIRLNRRGTPTDDEHLSRWVRSGYLYVSIFVLAGVGLSFSAEAGAWVAGPLWVGLPAVVSLLGLLTLGEQQLSLVVKVPSAAQMQHEAEALRAEMRRLSAGLAQELSQVMGAQARLAARGAMAMRARQYGLLDRLGLRVRQVIKQAHEHERRHAELVSVLLPLVAQEADEGGKLTDELLAAPRAALARLRAEAGELRTNSSAMQAEVKAELDRLKWLE